MDNPISKIQNPPASDQQHFKKWSECLKAIKKLPIPATAEEQHGIVTQLLNSPERQHLAFEFLLWRQSVRGSSKYQWLDATATNLLSNGQPGLAYSTLTTPTEAGQWVFRQLRDVNTSVEWNNFVKEERHLWLLHNIFGLAANKPALIEAILALVECISHAQANPGPGKPRKTVVSSNDSEWIVRLAKSRISARAELNKSFLEALLAIAATAKLSDELRDENERLRSQQQKTCEHLASEKQARESAEAVTARLQIDLISTKQDLADIKMTLEEESKHTLRSSGFNNVARQETITQVLAVVRQGISHRLDNIRQFADRENPNKVEILELVQEIEHNLASVEERLKQ